MRARLKSIILTHLIPVAPQNLPHTINERILCTQYLQSHFEIQAQMILNKLSFSKLKHTENKQSFQASQSP